MGAGEQGPACRGGQEGDPASDSFLWGGTPTGSPHSPAAAWLWGAPLWVPSGGQRSSPLSTAPTSLRSTTIEGSRWPSRGPFSWAPTAACGRVGRGQGNAGPWAPHSLLLLSWGPHTHVFERVPACPPPHPWGWGTVGPTWASPLGPFHRREPEAGEAEVTQSVCTPHRFPAGPLLGVFPAVSLVSYLLRGAGKLLPWPPERLALGSLFRAHSAGAPPQALLVPSAPPPPFKAF